MKLIASQNELGFLSAVVWVMTVQTPKNKTKRKNKKKFKIESKLPCEDLCELLSRDHQKSQ
jgi:hypothetical protein